MIERSLLIMLALLIASGSGVVAQQQLEEGQSGENSLQLLQDKTRIELNPGLADLYRISTPAHLVIIGDPNIADATLIDESTILLTAKSLGSTNIIILDTNQQVVLDASITVKLNGASQVTVRRAVEPTSYLCRPGFGCVQSAPSQQSVTSSEAQTGNNPEQQDIESNGPEVVSPES